MTIASSTAYSNFSLKTSSASFFPNIFISVARFIFKSPDSGHCPRMVDHREN